MERCDKDKNGQISYMEFFAAQKNKNIGDEKIKKLVEKLSSFFKLQKKDQDKVLLEHKEHFEKLKHDYEQVCSTVKLYILTCLSDNRGQKKRGRGTTGARTEIAGAQG